MGDNLTIAVALREVTVFHRRPADEIALAAESDADRFYPLITPSPGKIPERAVPDAMVARYQGIHQDGKNVMVTLIGSVLEIAVRDFIETGSFLDDQVLPAVIILDVQFVKTIAAA
jgi:hypothetical protein